MRYCYFSILSFFIFSGCVTSVNNKNDITEVNRLYNQGNYSESLEVCEQILIDDSYNQEAIKLLRKNLLKLRATSLIKLTQKRIDISDIEASEWLHIPGIDFIDGNCMTYKWGAN